MNNLNFPAERYIHSWEKDKSLSFAPIWT